MIENQSTSPVPAKDCPGDRSLGPAKGNVRVALVIACLVVIATYGLMIDLKGVNSDEGIRLGIINGGQPFLQIEPATGASWAQVLKTNAPFAYQPLYFLIQNTVISVARTHDVVLLRLVNLFFLWVCLQGLIALSKAWALAPRLFLIGVFSFNAYLLMHVLQIREYIVGVAFYIWSTWFVLRLEARRLGREWTDVAWFAAYGVLLTLGFYVQTWVVFPAIGQALFMVAYRREAKWRFYTHLALSYLVVLSFTWPYLHTNQQKVNIGRWGNDTLGLWPQLSDGFHLVLAGHMTGHAFFTDFLCWFWLAVIATATGLLFRRKIPEAGGILASEYQRQGSLMLLSMLVPLAFQIGYFFRVDNLSVWPRYFVVHYFFLFWLVALAFKYLCELRRAPGLRDGKRRLLTAAIGAISAVMIASGCYQTRSYYQYPWLDTGLSSASNWRIWSAELSRVLQPDDVVLAYDFIGRSTLTFTRPVPNRIVLLPELETADLNPARRLVYLESVSVLPQRSALAARLAALGFSTVEEIKIHSSDGRKILPDWCILTFARPAGSVSGRE